MTNIVRKLPGPSDLLPLTSSFANLSAGTEFSSYKEPQWRFLLAGQDITGYVAQATQATQTTSIEETHPYETSDVDGESESPRPIFDGCVLRVHLDEKTVGFGMVLVNPTKRKRGIATLLLKHAFEIEQPQEDRGDRDEGKSKRMDFVLAVCSELGQSVYRRLGFKEAGIISFLKCPVSDLLQLHTAVYDKNDVGSHAFRGKECNEEYREHLFRLDQKATGFDRKDRLRILLDEKLDGASSSVAFISKKTCSGAIIAAAVARQECIDGPLIVGPMMGPEDCCIPLLLALVTNHFDIHDQQSSDKCREINAEIMVSDHADLVQNLLVMKGMTKLWESPSMTLDGKPVYRKGDGSYLAMLHPTLG